MRGNFRGRANIPPTKKPERGRQSQFHASKQLFLINVILIPSLVVFNPFLYSYC